MKSVTMRCPAYPNVMTPRQILNKILDTLLIAAVGGGLAAVTLLLLVL